MSENKNEKGFLANKFGQALDKGVYGGIGAAATAGVLTGDISSVASFFALGVLGTATAALVSSTFINKPKP